MRAASKASRNRPKTALSAHDLESRFEFPPRAHLLITTPSQICSWDAWGVHVVFRSSRRGIVAAKEIKDGSALLAVADDNVVVLHDTKRRQEHSWGLRSDEGTVRHLEYTADAKTLLLSTHLTTDIQRYSMVSRKLLAPATAHASPPVALAISFDGQIMVSASAEPPAIYLSTLSNAVKPILIEPKASEATVTVASFHSKRKDIFILGFADGTLAAYDASRMFRRREGIMSNQELVNRGEIGRLLKAHRSVLKGQCTAGVAAAAFLPGYSCRAVSAGKDGKCRIVDFAKGGSIVRTWPLGAAATSLSVEAVKEPINITTPNAGCPPERQQSNEASVLIAIGRDDGTVQIYSVLGLMIAQKTLRSTPEAILSLDWVPGRSPRPISGSAVARDGQKPPGVPCRGRGRAKEAEISRNEDREDVAAAGLAKRHTTFEHIGLPAQLRRQDATPAFAGRSARRMGEQPDEAEVGTVRRTPQAGGPFLSSEIVRIGRQADLLTAEYGASNESEHGAAPRVHVATPPFSRPRVSSKTFARAAVTSQQHPFAKPRNLALFPSDDSPKARDSRDASGTRAVSSRLNESDHAGSCEHKIALEPETPSRHNLKEAYAIESKNPSRFADANGTSAARNDVAPVSKNHRAADRPPENSGGRRGAAKQPQNFRFLRRPSDKVDTDQDSQHALRKYEVAHQQKDWPDDSHQGSSLDDGAWITSEEDHGKNHRKRRKHHIVRRPPARQTSRSRVESWGTVSTLHAKGHPKEEPLPKMTPAILDGSTEEERFSAKTCLSPDGSLSPGSKDIQRFFPRTSSLSPSKDILVKRKRRRTRPSGSNKSGEVTPTSVLVRCRMTP